MTRFWGGERGGSWRWGDKENATVARSGGWKTPCETKGSTEICERFPFFFFVMTLISLFEWLVL